MAPSPNTLYRTLWRWHFYAGLFCIPFVISLSITGAIYLFKPQIENWTDRAYFRLETRGERATPIAHIQAAQIHLPSARFASYRLPQEDHHAVVITLRKGIERHLVYVHPYTLEILKSIPFDDQFTRIIRTLHGELLLGNVGSILIELAGCWAIVLIITGLYLWWPRSAQGLAGVLYPRFRLGTRKLLRDLHAVTGFWVAFFTLFLLISGLPWALVWGSAFKEIRSFGKPSVSQDWQVGRESVSTPATPDLSTHLTNTLLDKAYRLQFAAPVELGPDRRHPEQWKLSSGHQNRTLRADAWFNAEGELIKMRSFSERPGLDQAIGIGIAAHEGHLFGWFNQLLGLLTTLGLITVSLSGFIMWRRRKPSSSLGAPKNVPDERVGKTVFYITLFISLLLPVLSISLLVLCFIEKCILSQTPGIRAWLGIQPEQ